MNIEPGMVLSLEANCHHTYLILSVDQYVVTFILRGEVRVWNMPKHHNEWIRLNKWTTNGYKRLA